MPYYVTLFRGGDARSLGLSRDGRKANVQALDARDYTVGGIVVFEIERSLTS
jgi:hypothetical protein